MSALSPARDARPAQSGSIVLLPHFMPHRDGLQTIGGRVIALGKAERDLAAACTQERPCNEAAEDETTTKLIKAGYLAKLPPRIALAGPRALILSPHIDDAALSLGGFMASRRARTALSLVLNVFSKQSYQSGLRVPAEQLDAVAHAEDRLASRILGYESRALGLRGAQDRLGLTLRDVMGWRADDVRAHESFRSDLDAVVESAIRALDGVPRVFDRLIAPAAIGGHVDHVLVALAAPRVAARLGISPSRIVLYEDLPYAAAGMAGAFGMEERGRQLEPFTAVEDKRAALSVFKTRLRAPQIALCLAYARAIAGGNGAAEVLFMRRVAPPDGL